ncbi:MAG: hypothetical protein MJY95_01410 [Bacteroidaceae bacterium]|nr:hypothetical protein [Bacteroidaceae bacterium]
MAKVIKKMNLSAESSTEVNEAVLKGTPENPYTQEEMTTFGDGTWPGGFVEGMGYLPPSTIGVGSSSSEIVIGDTDDMDFYVGIYLDGSHGTISSQDIILTDGIVATVHYRWNPGYTGNFSNNIPNWIRSTINIESIDVRKDLLNASPTINLNNIIDPQWEGPCNTNWKKIRKNHYCINLTFNYTWSTYENINGNNMLVHHRGYKTDDIYNPNFEINE